MENQQAQQLETSAGIPKGKITLALGIIAAAIVIGITIFANASSGTISSPSAVAAQKEFQDKLMTAQIEFQQKVEAATKEAEQVSSFDLSNSSAMKTQKEFQQKINAATKEVEQKSDSILNGLEQK